MKKFLVGLMLMLGIGCGIKPPIKPPQPPPTQAFAVVTYDYNTGAPVEGVAVSCKADELPQTFTGSTNGDGYIAWDSVRTGYQYACSLTKEGYEDNTVRHDVTVEDPTLYATITKLPPSIPEFPPTLVGRLRITNNCFADDTGCVTPVYEHAGDLFSKYTREPEVAISQLNEVASAGYSGIRLWAVLGGDYWAGREVGPGVSVDYWGKVDSFLRELQLRNLRAVWSMGDIGQLRGTRADYMRALAERDGGAIDFLDCGNEAWQTGEPDPNKLSECVGYYRAAGGQAILTLTSPPGEETRELNDYSIGNAQIFDVHGYRGGNFWDKIRHIFSISYEGRPNKRQGIQSEPFGNGRLVSVTQNKDELDGETMALASIMSALSRQTWVHFSGEGVMLDKGLQTESGFFETPKATALLPKDIATFPVLHHSGGTWASIRILVPPNDNIRVDGAQHPDGRVVQLIYGPSGSYRFQVARTVLGKLCNPATAQCDPVNWIAGSFVDMSFIRGRVFIGQIQ